MTVTDILNTSLDGLESIYNELSQASMEREFLTNDECDYVYKAIGDAANLVGAKAVDIVPSLESDNYFERNNIQVSMEAISQSIKDGAKAFFKKIFEMLKTVCTRITETYKNLVGRLTKLKQKISAVRLAKQKVDASKGKPEAVNTAAQAPKPATTNPTSPEAQESVQPSKPATPQVTKFQITIRLLQIDGVADKVNSAESMNAYITKLSQHLSALTRDFSQRMEYGPDTNNFAVDSMKDLQNVEVVEAPEYLVIDVTREWSTWERWEKTTVPHVEATFNRISKTQVQTKMQQHLIAAERAVNTEKDEAKLTGYRQRINELGKMIKTFDMLLTAIASVDVRPMASPPPNPT